jgi:hypothetical protein
MESAITNVITRSGGSPGTRADSVCSVLCGPVAWLHLSRVTTDAPRVYGGAQSGGIQPRYRILCAPMLAHMPAT